MALRPVQFNMLRYQASFRRRARSRWLGAAVSRLVANIWKSAYLTPAQALPGFVALSHENPKIALPQTAKCGLELWGVSSYFTNAFTTLHGRFPVLLSRYVPTLAGIM